MLRSWLEPDQELVVAEVVDQSAAFASAPPEGNVVGPSAAHVQDQQRWMSLGRRVELEGDVTAVTEIGKCGGEQSSRRLD